MTDSFRRFPQFLQANSVIAGLPQIYGIWSFHCGDLRLRPYACDAMYRVIHTERSHDIRLQTKDGGTDYLPTTYNFHGNSCGVQP